MDAEIIKKDAYRYAIKNAYLHDGKANLGAVIGKIIALHKIDAKKIVPLVKEEIEKVNAMSFKEIEKEYSIFEETYELKPKQKEEVLPKIEGLVSAITRFAPNPSAYPHIGHARAAILCYEYSKKYPGKFILRFDDTDPKIKTILKDSKEIFLSQLKWLGIVPDKVYFASENMDKYYEYMRLLVSKGEAYVCTCLVEEWREKIRKGMACPCRSLPISEQMKRLEKMFSHKYKEGEAVLRLKTDLKHKDPSVRDWWLAKIVDNPIHPFVKDKYVWPSYNFSSGLEDHFEGITLIIRGQEHEQNATKQKFLYNKFGWTYPKCIHFGRIITKDSPISKTIILEGIKSGKYLGWDDPRLLTLESLRKRGYQPEAIKKLILDMGTTSSDAFFDPVKLANYNREIIMPLAQRLPLFKNIKNLHLDKEYSVEKDGIFYRVKDIFISSEIKGLIKLRNIGVFEIKDCQAIPSTKSSKFIVDWLENPIKIKILEANAELKEYYTEKEIEKIKEYVYFSKYGFCYRDLEKGIFRFTHN